MKRIISAVGMSALGLSLLLTTGCSRESNQTQPAQSQSGADASKAPASGQAADDRGNALVRVVNAVPGAQAIDVAVDANKTFDGVDYKAITPYKEVPANADDFTVRPANADAGAPALAENSEGIMSGRHYTAIAFPEPTDPGDKSDKKVSLEVIADDLQPPSSGKARVRVINAAAGTDDLAVYVKGQEDALFSDVDFKEAVAYKEVDPLKTTMEVRPDPGMLSSVNPKTGESPAAGQPADPAARADRADADRKDRADRTANAELRPGQVLITKALDLEPGKSYTIVLAGRATGGARQLDALVVEDVIPQTAPPTE